MSKLSADRVHGVRVVQQHHNVDDQYTEFRMGEDTLGRRQIIVQ